ncbi:MAG: permease prefix domain 1-containing protein [Micropruina sp.]|uniref:permease prefix domain 1-containing protein n=1 Tax=Micropruina sp. TaxID=2737536 RepID=UPI0039E65596
MSDPINEYRADLRRQLTGVPGADDVVAELDDHLRESTETLTRHGMNPAQADAVAIGRLGNARTVARSVRVERGWLRGRDLVIVARRPFLIAELLLILAALAYAVATLLHDLPCDRVGAGEVDGMSAGTLHECLGRGEDWELAPFFPPLPLGLAGLNTASATLLFLVAAIAMAVAVVQFAGRQPWLRPTRRWALLSGALTVATGLAATVQPLNPASRIGWSMAAALGVDLALLCTLALLWTSGMDPALTAGAERAPKPGVVMTYTRYRVRVSLILLASAGCGIHFLQQVALAPVAIVIAELRRTVGYLGWAPTPLLGQLHTLLVVLPVLASMILGRRSRQPAAPATSAPDQDAVRLA